MKGKLMLTRQLRHILNQLLQCSFSTFDCQRFECPEEVIAPDLASHRDHAHRLVSVEVDGIGTAVNDLCRIYYICTSRKVPRPTHPPHTIFPCSKSWSLKLANIYDPLPTWQSSVSQHRLQLSTDLQTEQTSPTPRPQPSLNSRSKFDN